MASGPKIDPWPQPGAPTEREFAMSALKSTTAVRKAYDATAAVLTQWADAYAATADDLAKGATLRDIADDWRKARITPANKDSVGDMAEAARLATYGADYAAAVSEFFGEGALKPAHYIVGKARKARGMAYVRAVLTALEDTLAGVEDLTAEVTVAAIVKAIRTLEAAKREVKPDVTDEADEATTGETTDETTDEADETTDEATTVSADSRADSVIAVLAAMLKDGDVPDEARRRTMVESMRALMAAWKADATAAA